MGKSTKELLQKLNEIRGVGHPDVGHSVFIDLYNVESSYKQVYTAVDTPGNYLLDEELNGGDAKARRSNIKAAIAKCKKLRKARAMREQDAISLGQLVIEWDYKTNVELRNDGDDPELPWEVTMPDPNNEDIVLVFGYVEEQAARDRYEQAKREVEAMRREVK